MGTGHDDDDDKMEKGKKEEEEEAKEDDDSRYFVDTNPLRPLDLPGKTNPGKTSMTRLDAIQYGLVFIGSWIYGASRSYDRNSKRLVLVVYMTTHT